MDSQLMQAAAAFVPAMPNPWAHLGQAAAVAYDSRAPQDEVREAGLELAGTYLQDLVGLVDFPDAQMVRDWDRLRQAEATGNRLMMKALKTLNPAAAASKARTEALYATVGGGGLWLSKPGLPFESLRALSTRVEVSQAIHLTRRRHVSKFSELSTRDDVVGFRIRHADGDHELTDDQKSYARWLAKFLLNGGREFRPHVRRSLQRETLREFLAALTDEGLTLDHAAVETVPLLQMEGLDSFHLRDGATFYLAAPSDPGVYAYQSLSGLPDASFDYDELAIFQRNTSPDVHRRGYGRSELEASVETMTLFLQAMEFTREGIDNNAVPRGILTVYGQFDRRQEEAFRTAWSAKMRGVKNRFGLPVLFSKNGQAAAQFTSTNGDFSEMAFAKWMSLQVSIMSAIYGIDPKEINVDGFTSGTTSTLGGNDTAEKLAAAKDKGLAPFLSDVEGFISDSILARFDGSGDWRFQFTGVEPGDVKARQAREDRVMTINEMRTALQMDPHPIGWFGDLPSDASLLSAEFQRVEKSFTYDEARRTWGGLKAFPNALVGAAPINPNMQAQYQSATQAEQDPQGLPDGQEDPWGDFDGGQDEEGQGDRGEPGLERDPLPAGGPGAQALAALRAMRAGKDEEPVDA